MFGPRKSLVVWQGIPGEEARVRIVHEGPHQDQALFLETDTPDPHRVEPPCERYTLCGGCPLMHLDAPGQEVARRTLMRQALEDAGLPEVEIGAFHASPSGLEDFRHTIKVGFGYSDQGHIRVGAWGRRDAHIVPIPKCNVAHPVLRSVMIALAHHTIALDIWPYDAQTGRGVLRAAVLRISRTTGEVLVTLVASRRTPQLRDLAEAIAGQVSAVVGVWVHLNAEPGNAIMVRDEGGTVQVMPLTGKGALEETLGEVTYLIGPGDFFQTNPAMADVLYRRVLQQIESPKSVPVVDLYAGVGGLALQAAASGWFAYGVEAVEGAVARARETARRQGLQAEFVCGSVGDALPDLARRLVGRHPVVILDPARRGLEPGVIDGILSLEPSEIVYVSCNPRALARDLAAFKEADFTIGPIELFDMFPNTAHVEALVTLRSTVHGELGGRAPRRKVVR